MSMINWKQKETEWLHHYINPYINEFAPPLSAILPLKSSNNFYLFFQNYYDKISIIVTRGNHL